MPTVPRYERQISEAGVPDVRLQSRAPSSAEGLTFPGGAAIRVLEQVEGAMDDARREADRVKEQQSRVALNKWEIDNVYDFQTGAAGTVGEESLDIIPTLKGSLDKFSADYRESLSGSRQRAAFDAMVADRWGHVEQWANQHIARQMEVLKETSYKATLESSKERAAADPGTRDTELAVIQQSVMERMGGKMTPEVISAELRKQEADVHVRIIGRYLADGNDELAQAYYDENKGRLDQEDQERVEGRIARRSEELKRARTEQIETAALNVIEKTKDFDALPKSVIEMLPRESRAALRSYADKLARGPVETDPEVYYALTHASNEQLVSMNLMPLVDKLSRGDFKKWADFQRNLREGKVPTELDGYRTTKMIVDDALRGAKIDPTPKDKSKEAERVARFHKAVDEQVVEFQKQTGKKATNADIQKIADDLLRKVTVKDAGFLWRDKDKMVYELSPGDVTVPVKKRSQVPDEDVVKIEAAIRNKGWQVTDELVVDMYNMKLRRLVDGGE